MYTVCLNVVMMHQPVNLALAQSYSDKKAAFTAKFGAVVSESKSLSLTQLQVVSESSANLECIIWRCWVVLANWLRAEQSFRTFPCSYHLDA